MATVKETSVVAVPAADSAESKQNRRRARTKAARVNVVPDDICKNVELVQAMKALPSNYNFEIFKTIWRLRQASSRMVALQFPEGLLMYACIISDILERFAGVETLVMGDVTYGACCVDDYAARALGCDFMVHYGHSCLVPIDVSQINMLYVFVDIGIDVDHLVESLKANFDSKFKMVLAGTIQFATGMQTCRKLLQGHFAQLFVPQAKPLSPGEVLGCTSPRFGDKFDALVFVADGRFHLESIMIHNPEIPNFYKYDPYNKKLTLERYAYKEMHDMRKQAIESAKSAKRYGLIMGTLGRQGSPKIMARLEGLLKAKGIPYITVLLSEIFPAKLALMNKDVDAWVQVACPRLSIDWGYAFDKPLLSSYEAEVALEQTPWREVYPMDYYAAEGGAWTNYAGQAEERKAKLEARRAARAAAGGSTRRRLRGRRKKKKNREQISIEPVPPQENE